MKSGTIKPVVVTLVVVAGIAAVVGLVTIRSGAYNVAATKPHHAMTESILSTMMDNSVRRHASDIELSPSFSDPNLDEGFQHYQAMCVACHGAPGLERSEIGLGLNPPAPNLAEMDSDHSAQEVFWIIKNGIKMTGMPALGPTHDDETLWNLTAFVKCLPSMTPDQYREMAGETGHGEHAHHH